MFNDDYTAKESSDNPASVLLMDIIKAPSKESNRKVELKDPPESGFSVKEAPDGFLEQFITEHESVIRDKGLLDPSFPADSSASETTEIPGMESCQMVQAKRLSWWEKWFAKSSIGIEINSRMIRAAKIRTWGRKQEIVQLEEIVLDESKKGDTFAIAMHIQNILRQLKSSHIPVTSIIGGSDVNLRLLRMPKVSKKEIHDALLWKNKKELHFFNDAPTILHYVILDEDQTPNANEFYVLVIAVKEDLIKHSLEIMEQAKTLPSKMTIRPIAQWNFMRNIPGKGINSLVIDMGFENSHLTFFRNDTLQFAREIPVGGNHFTAALMQTIFVDDRSYILSWDEAESVKKDIGLPVEPVNGKTPQGIPYSEIAVMMRPVAEKLASEIRMSLDYYKENFKVDTYDNIYFTGNSVRLKRLKTFLESSIGQPMRPLFLTEAIALPADFDSEKAGELSMDTIGAALSKGSDLNFLPPQAKTELRFRNLYSKAISGMLILLSVLGGSVLFLDKKYNDLEDILTISNSSLTRVRNENREYDQLQNEMKDLHAIRTKIEEETGMDSSMLNIVKWISGITPEQIALDQLSWGNAYNEMELRRMGTNQTMKANNAANSKSSDDVKELRIKGEVFTDVFYADIHLLNFITTMEKNPFFKEVQLKEKQRRDGETSLQFELIAKKK